MGYCFSEVVVSKEKVKKNFIWEKRIWYWKKGWLFLIGNGAEIRPLEMGRKSSGTVYFDQSLRL